MRFITPKTDRFTVAEYLKMDRAGLFDDQRVELVLGRIVKMHAQADPHKWAIAKGTRKLISLFPAETHYVLIQSTLYLGRYGAPDPDFHVHDVPEGTPQDRLPLPFIVIEVSDTTYRKDSGLKVIQYASARIQDYWIVNIPQGRIEVHRQPDRHAGPSGGWGYRDIKPYTPGQQIAFLARPEISVNVTDFLP